VKRRYNKSAFLAVIIAVSMFVNAVLVIQSVQYTYEQWVGGEAIEQLEWVTNNLNSSVRPLIFVINRSTSSPGDWVELWRRVIGCFVPNSLIYIGRIDDLLLLNEPRFNDTKLQAFAEQYWNELKTQVKYPENLTSFKLVILSYFYQPITKLELDTRLFQLSDGVYIVDNYTAPS
jgi:hypothetical protein